MKGSRWRNQGNSWATKIVRGLCFLNYRIANWRVDVGSCTPASSRAPDPSLPLESGGPSLV